jgi:hypothetical protein
VLEISGDRGIINHVKLTPELFREGVAQIHFLPRVKHVRTGIDGWNWSQRTRSLSVYGRRDKNSRQNNKNGEDAESGAQRAS